MPVDLAGYVAREVARGLYHAHTLTNQGKPLGIVHRDVSPSNIMVLRTGGVKLLDFGIARATMKLRSVTPIGGLVKGKLSYLSPEQVRGQGVDNRSDIFSLGVVLWECLTGLRLFYDPNDLETMRNVLHRPIPRPSEVRAGVPRALDVITLRALGRDLDARYPDAAAMASELEEYLRECRFSPESAVRLLDELFAGEDSARELPLPGESSLRPRAVANTRGTAPTDSVPPPAAPDDADDTINDYATVSSVHRMAEIVGRQRRRRVIQASAGMMTIAALSVAVLFFPGVRTQPAPVARPAQIQASAAHWADASADPESTRQPVVAQLHDPTRSQAGIEIEPTSPPAEEELLLPDELPLLAVAGSRSRREESSSRTSRERSRDRDRDRDRDRSARSSSAVDPARGRRALSRGMEALRTGEYMLAVQELEVALQATPSSPEVLKALAEAEFELARYPRALGHARRAVEVAPKDGPIRALLGDAYFKLRRFKEASESYAAAVALAPSDASIRARQKRAGEKVGGIPEESPPAQQDGP
jgi:hypothetical protein